MKNDLNFIFWGTPKVASETLEILKKNGYIPSLIITTPDKPQGRKMIMTSPPVKTWAIKNNIPYLQPEKITPEFIKKLSQPKTFPAIGLAYGQPGHRQGLWPDLFIVVAYGKILPEEIINLPKFGTINIHYSLLPKYRGASPLEACLLNGDEKTGISIQQMVFKLDSGPIICEKEILININETKNEIREKLTKIGAEMLIKFLPKIIAGNLKFKYQNENEATFCKKIKKEDGLINLNEDAKELYNKYRAYENWPGIYFFTEKNNHQIRIKITKAKYENSKFVIEKIIPENKKEIDYKNFQK